MIVNNLIPIADYDKLKEAKRPVLKWTNTNDLMATKFDPIRWVVPGYLPEGLSVLAGRQKLGKTWLALDIAAAVATGGYAMGSVPCEAGDVLYIDMENGKRRVQRRIETLFPNAEDRPDLSRLNWMNDAPALDKGMIQDLDEWRQSVAKPTMVIIDVLQKIKPIGSTARTAYENDYSIWSPLQRWATENGIAVLGLHHCRKGGAEDPLESLSGSNGLSACADTTLVLDKRNSDVTLYVRGRDVDEKETAMAFAGGLWSITGDASKVRTTTERQRILDALEDAGEPMTPSELAAVIGLPANNVKQLCFKMAKAEPPLVVRSGKGKYALPGKEDAPDKTETAAPPPWEDPYAGYRPAISQSAPITEPITVQQSDTQVEIATGYRVTAVIEDAVITDNPAPDNPDNPITENDTQRNNNDLGGYRSGYRSDVHIPASITEPAQIDIEDAIAAVVAEDAGSASMVEITTAASEPAVSEREPASLAAATSEVLPPEPAPDAEADLKKKKAAVRTMAWKRNLKFSIRSGAFAIEPLDGGTALFASDDLIEVEAWLKAAQVQRRGGEVQHVEG